MKEIAKAFVRVMRVCLKDNTYSGILDGFRQDSQYHSTSTTKLSCTILLKSIFIPWENLNSGFSYANSQLPIIDYLGGYLHVYAAEK